MKTEGGEEIPVEKYDKVWITPNFIYADFYFVEAIRENGHIEMVKILHLGCVRGK